MFPGVRECVNLKPAIESTMAALRKGPRPMGWAALRSRLAFLGLPPCCLYCGAAGDLGPIDACACCLTVLPWSVDSTPADVLSTLEYRGSVADDLRALKFRGDRRSAAVYGTLLAVRAALVCPPERRPAILVPVPLHPERLAQRGFNQAALLARRVGAWLGIPVDESLLARRLATLPQSSLPAAARRDNVREAFVATERLRHRLNFLSNRSVALIDDVTTTGATLAAAAGALESAGVVAIQRWVVARTMPSHTARPTY